MIYEILYIIPSKYSDTEVDGVVEKVSKIFSKHNSEIKKTNNIGKIKLAYPIDRVTHGTYILMYAEIESKVVVDIDADFKLSEEVLRHTILKREKGIPLFEFNMTSYEAPLTPEGKRNTDPRRKSETIQKTVKEESKLSVKELDKKLDEILESDIVADV